MFHSPSIIIRNVRSDSDKFYGKSDIVLRKECILEIGLRTIHGERGTPHHKAPNGITNGQLRHLVELRQQR